jgi:tetratricopeptide (TPR) repeat protein
LRAGALNHGLAPRESLLVAADSLFASVLNAPKADTAALSRQRRLVNTLEQATRRYPEDPEMWHVLGDARFHFGWLALDSAQRTLDAFDQAIALDSAFAPSYIYAIELAGRLGDAAAMRRYAAAYVAVNPADSDFRLVHWLLDPIHSRSAETRQVLEKTSPASLTHVWHLLQTLPDSAEVAVRVARQIQATRGGDAGTGGPDDPIFRRRLLAATLAYRGHLREAYQDVAREDYGLFVSLFAELALEGGVPPDTAAALLDRWLQRTPFWPAGGLLFALPWWGTRGDTSSLIRFARRADSTRVPAAVPGWAGGIHDSPRYASAAARAYLALARSDTADALLRLAALPLAKCEWCFLERLTYARLLEARGRDAKALSVLGGGFPMPFAWPTRPVWMLERARVASRLGEREKAVQSYGFVADVWREADPLLQPYVAEARAALDR